MKIATQIIDREFPSGRSGGADDGSSHAQVRL